MGLKNITPNRELRIPSAGNVSIHCRCYGQSEEAVVLLHGNGEDYRCFSKQIEPFSMKYFVIAIDSRGHGSSDMGEPFSLSDMADDVKTVLDALHIDKAHIIGFSDGANVAIYFALRYQSRLGKLVLAGANLFPTGLEKKVCRKDKRKWNVLRFCGKFSHKFEKKARIYDLMIHEPNIDPWELEAIESPTLVLAGQHDMVQETHTRLIAKSIPYAHLRIIPACDHFVFQNQAEWVNTTILRFLARH